MHIGILTLQFHLEGCASLKEKRKRLSGLRDRFGRKTSIAVCEYGCQDAWQKAEWGFVAAASSRSAVKGLIDNIEREVSENFDGRIVERQVEML